MSGRPPFAGNTAEQVLRRHRSRLAPSLATLAPAAPDSLVKLVARCLRKDPAGRPTTVGQLREALSQAASEAVWPTRLPSKDIQGEVRQEGKPHWWQRGVLRVFAPRPS